MWWWSVKGGVGGVGEEGKGNVVEGVVVGEGGMGEEVGEMQGGVMGEEGMEGVVGGVGV